MSDHKKNPPFSLHIPILFRHCDPAGYVFFPRFYEMFQDACEVWMTEHLGIDLCEMIVQQKTGQPTAYLECQFIQPCLLGEKLDIAVILDKFGTSSIEIRFIGTVAGQVRLRARSVQVVISLKDGRPAPIKSEMRERMQAYMEQTEAPDNLYPQRR